LLKEHTVDALAEALEAGWAAASRDDPEPTVSYFRDLLRRYPDEPRALLGYAGALDFAGREPEAAPVYQQALEAGLDGDDLRRCLIQYGSTLRNIGQVDQAVAMLRQAARQFPGQDSVQAFLALALATAGRPGEAVALLLNLALDRIDSDDLRDYQVPLRYYATELADQPGVN
jgi:tetratricopeptide (TPR) repeat protein